MHRADRGAAVALLLPKRGEPHRRGQRHARSPLETRNREPSRARRHGNRGFTLIEVMVALAITLIALEVLFSGIASSLRIARTAAIQDRAISRAESHLAAIADPALILGQREGDDGAGYRWRTRVAFLGAAPAPATARPGPWSHGTGLYAVSVTVFWHEDRGERSFELDSARLGPVPGSGSAP